MAVLVAIERKYNHEFFYWTTRKGYKCTIWNAGSILVKKMYCKGNELNILIERVDKWAEKNLKE